MAGSGAAAETDGAPADALDEIQCTLAFLLGDDLAEQGAQQPNFQRQRIRGAAGPDRLPVRRRRRRDASEGVACAGPAVVRASGAAAGGRWSYAEGTRCASGIAGIGSEWRAELLLGRMAQEPLIVDRQGSSEAGYSGAGSSTGSANGR